MKIGEYRTNGKQVAYRRDANTLLLWPDSESMSTSRPITDPHADILTHGWRTMTPFEVALWCAPPSPAEAVSAKAEATIGHLKETVKILSEGLAKWRPIAEAATAEVDRLRNAARSRLKCPNGHSPSQSRGPCWYCDAERNAGRLAEAEAALAQARKVAAAMDIYYHRQGCPYGMCNCGADAGNKARRELLAILEVKS